MARVTLQEAFDLLFDRVRGLEREVDLLKQNTPLIDAGDDARGGEFIAVCRHCGSPKR